VRNYTFAGVGVATIPVGTSVQVKGILVTPDCKTCLKNRRDGRVVPVCPECRKVYGLDHQRAAVRPNLYTPVEEAVMDSPEAAAPGYPLGKSLARFMGRLIISAGILAIIVLPLVSLALQRVGGGGEFIAALKISVILLPLWVLAGLLPSLADWKKNPLLAILTTFGPPAFLAYKVLPALFK
jgi:hypothetical protein